MVLNCVLQHLQISCFNRLQCSEDRDLMTSVFESWSPTSSPVQVPLFLPLSNGIAHTFYFNNILFHAVSMLNMLYPTFNVPKDTHNTHMRDIDTQEFLHYASILLHVTYASLYFMSFVWEWSEARRGATAQRELSSSEDEELYIMTKKSWRKHGFTVPLSYRGSRIQ